MSDFAELRSRGYRLGVAPSRIMRSLVNLETAEAEQAQHFIVTDLQQGLMGKWPSDAHFVTYYVEGRQDGEAVPEESWPRLSKKGPVLHQIRLHGGDVKVWGLVWDWDTGRLFEDGKKRPLTQELLLKFNECFIHLPDKVYEWASKFTYFYTTTNGVRLVYVLKNPISVDKAEALHKYLTRQLQEGGLHVDSLSDWTRFFRCPRVMRVDDEDPTQTPYEFPNESHLFEELWQPYLFDPVPIVGEGILTTPTVVPQKLDYPKPSADEVVILIGTEEQRPDWWGEVKKELRGKLCFTTIYEHRLLSSQGSRDTTIQRFVGEVSRAFSKRKEKGENFTPAHVFAMLYDAVCQLEPDNQTPDWTDVLWKACLHYWAKELARIEEKVITKEATTLVSMSLSDTIIAGMRVWCNAPELRADDQTAIDYASQHFIACTLAGLHYVMDKTGFYHPVPVKTAMLKAKIREMGMEPVIPLGYETENGYRPYAPNTLVERHGTGVVAVEGHAGGPGNYIKGLREDYPVMVLRLYERRKDLKPVFNTDVDAWLRQLGDTEEGYRKLTSWIGHALAFDEGPIAALALVGSRGVGKKMLAGGLAECMSTGMYADTGDMGKYQANLMRSPFLVINEGLKRGRDGYDPADYFRLLTGGDPLQVEKKFMDPVTVKAPIRVLILANNSDVLASLAGNGRNLSIEDKLALAQRLVIVRVRERAANWLRMQGGKKFTRGWIQDDAGGFSSDLILASHFMHLYENRPAVDYGNRFLVEGNAEDKVVNTLSTRSGHAPIIIEILVAVIEAVAERRNVEGAYVQEKEDIEGAEKSGPLPRVWVTAHAIQSWARRQMMQGIKDVPQREVIKVFRGLTRRGEPETGRELNLNTSLGARKAFWFNLDLDTLLREAYELGYQCANLEALVKQTEAARVLKARTPV